MKNPTNLLLAVSLSANLFATGYIFAHREAAPPASLARPSAARSGSAPALAVAPAPGAAAPRSAAGLLAIADAALRRALTDSLVSEATESDLRSLLAAALASPTSPRRNALLTAIFHRWGELNPEAALAAVPEPARSSLQPAVLAGWAVKDPAAAFAWYRRESKPVDASQLRSAAASSLTSSLLEAGRDREVQAQLTELAADPDLRSQAGAIAKELAVHYGTYDPAAGMRWLAGLAPNSAERKAAAQELGRAIAQDFPDLAIDFALGLGEQDGRTGVMMTVFDLAGRSMDANAALRWTASQSPGPDRDTAIRQMVPNLALRDPAAGAQLLDVLSTPQLRNSVVFSAALNIARLGPIGAAFDFAISSLPGDGSRLPVLQSVARFGANSDPQGTIQWISTAGSLSANEQQLLLTMAQASSR